MKKIINPWLGHPEYNSLEVPIPQKSTFYFCSVVMRYMFAICPLIDRTITEQIADK